MSLMVAPDGTVTRVTKKKKMNKRTTETFKQYYGGFCGWNNYINMLKTCDSFKTKIMMILLLKFGCRAMELPTLRKRQINYDFSPTQIMVQGMHVEKQKELLYLVDQEGKPLLNDGGKKLFKFESKEGSRTFPIPKNEPLSNELITYVKTIKNDDDLIFPLTYNQMRYRICQIGSTLPEGVSKKKWSTYKGPWWHHRIRSERACQLIKDYEYSTFRLKKWMGWSSSQMPDVYADMLPIDLITEKEVVWR